MLKLARKHIRTGLLIASSLLMITAVTAYVISPRLIASAAHARLAEYGVIDLHLQAGYPGVNIIRIEQTSFKIEKAGKQIEIHIPEMLCQYNVNDLLFAGRLQALEIPKIEVRMQPISTGNDVTQTSASIPLGLLLTSHWFSYIPVDELTVKNAAIIADDGHGKTDAIELSGMINNGRLEVNGVYDKDTNRQSFGFKLQTSYQGESQLTITDSEQNKLLAWQMEVVNVAQADQRLALNGSISGDLGSLFAYIKPWQSWLETISEIKGDVSGKWRAQVPSTWHPEIEPLQLSMDINITAITGLWRATNDSPVLGFERGDLKLNAQANWQKVLQLNGMLKLEDLAGYYEKNTFAGVKAQIPFRYDSGNFTNNDAMLNIAAIDTGFPVTDTAINFSAHKNANMLLPKIKLKEFKSHVFDGAIRLEPAEYDLAATQHSLSMLIEGISLPKLIALEQQEGIEATGTLDGKFPILVQDKQIRVIDGKLSSRKPGGVIRYRPTERIAALADTNQSIGMMTRALSNFQYQLLDVTSNYQPSGDLELKVRLEGKNPDWDGGRPVNLNLNLQENVLKLFESLQLDEKISDKIREFYQKTP